LRDLLTPEGTLVFVGGEDGGGWTCWMAEDPPWTAGTCARDMIISGVLREAAVVGGSG
jgi:hypothetical protein